MKRNLVGIVALLLALSPTVAACAATPPDGAAPASWTVMVYLDADNDLERSLMKNLEEMAKAGSTSLVNVIVLAARSPEGKGKYSNAGVVNLPNWTSARLLRVAAGKLQELADWGSLDLGDGASLQRFVSTATQSYPARHYALLLGDHGMAWAGAAVAESMGDGDSLSVDEMAAALKSALPAGNRFELIGFDACVMSNLEVARTLAPYSRYLVASEEIEPSDGWDYAALFSALTQTPEMDGARLGRTIVDTYRDFYARSANHERASKAKGLTLALIDLEQIGAVNQAVIALGAGTDALLKRGGHAAWLQLARAHSQSEDYGRSAMPADRPLPGSDVYDLINVGENLQKLAADPASSAAADALIAATRRAIVYNMHGAARPHANGLSIFYPPDQVTLAVRGKTSYKETSFAAGSAWYPYLKNYVDFPASPAERNRPRPAIDPVTSTGRMLQDHGKVNIATQVRADDIDEARFVISMLEGNARVIIGSIPVDLQKDGGLKQEWDGEWFTISDNDNEFIAPITEFEEVGGAGNDDQYWAGVPAKLRIADTEEWLPVTLYFVLDFGDDSEAVSGDFIYAVEYTAHGPHEIDLDAGDDLQPLYQIIDGDGISHREVMAGERNLIHIDNDTDDLKVNRTAVSPGHYQVGFAVRDLAGRESERLVEVEVQAGVGAEASGAGESGATDDKAGAGDADPAGDGG